MSWERKVQKKPTWGSSTQAPQESLFKTRGFSKPVEQPLEETALKPIQFRGTDTSHLDHLKVSSTNRPIVSPKVNLSSLQAKLTVGAPGDKYEQEADAMANQVMSMPDAAVQRETVGEEQSEEVRAKPLASAITPLLQREAMPEEELQTKPLAASISSLVQREAVPEDDEKLHPKALAQPLDQRIAPIQREAMLDEEEVHPKLSEAIAQREAIPDEEDNPLQGKAIAHSDIQREEMSEDDEMRMKPVSNGTLQRAPDGNLQAGEGIESRLNQSKGGGSPLSDEVRSFMEPRFGSDFSHVRVHTGGAAIQMNRDLGAQAFTHGSDIYFGAGKSPANSDLTAHELTHVVQQTGRVQAKFLTNRLTVQRECSACGEEEKVQRSIDISSTPEAIQQREVCDDEGVCRSEPDPVESSSSNVVTLPEIVIEGDPNNPNAGSEAASGSTSSNEVTRGESSGIWNTIKEGAAGLAYGTTQGLTPGGFAAPSPMPQSRAFEFFRGAGQIATGVAETVVGAGGEVIGTGLDATVGGAVIGVPINVASAAIAANGATSAVAGVGTMAHAMSMGGSGSYSKDTKGPATLKSPDEATRGKSNDWSSYYRNEGEARQIARQKVGKDPIEVEPYKWRSQDGKWQYRAKPGDIKDGHIHLEELDPDTSTVLQNLHLRWPAGSGR